MKAYLQVFLNQLTGVLATQIRTAHRDRAELIRARTVATVTMAAILAMDGMLAGVVVMDIPMAPLTHIPPAIHLPNLFQIAVVPVQRREKRKVQQLPKVVRKLSH